MTGHANNAAVLNVVTAQIQTLFRRNSLPHRLRERFIGRVGWASGLAYELALEDSATAWPPERSHLTNAED